MNKKIAWLPASNAVGQLQRVVTDLCERIAALEGPTARATDSERDLSRIVGGLRDRVTALEGTVDRLRLAALSGTGVVFQPAPPQYEISAEDREELKRAVEQVQGRGGPGTEGGGTHSLARAGSTPAASPAAPSPEPTDEDREAPTEEDWRYQDRLWARMEDIQRDFCIARALARARAEGAAGRDSRWKYLAEYWRKEAARLRDELEVRDDS